MVMVIVWMVAIGWTAFLLVRDPRASLDGFELAVAIMGSIGILYAVFLVSRPWARPAGTGGEEPTDDDREPSTAAARWTIIMLTLALAIGAIFYRLAQGSYLHQTSVFFIGLPAVLAITLALTPKAKSATGTIVKGLTLALLLAGVALAEGFICVLMAAPLFYLVGIMIGLPIDRVRRQKGSEPRMYSIIGVVVLLASLEGVMPPPTPTTEETVHVVRTVSASPQDVRAALSSAPEFGGALPVYLRLGFPRPVDAHGTGLAVGDRRTILFGDESPMDPVGQSRSKGRITCDLSARPDEARGEGGRLILQIVGSSPGRVVFEAVLDETAFGHWIGWGRSVVEWEAAGHGETRVTWRLQFQRKLSPGWYFAPWQRYAGRLAAGYLIEAAATP
jgi:hypothetical protein